MNRSLIAISAAAAIAALLAGTWYAGRDGGGDSFAACREGAVAGGADTIGGDFTLVNQDGATVTSAEVIDQPSLLYFGYTFCPDVCPMDMARNVEAIQILEDRGETVKPVFISVDPERDTPEVVGDFAANLHPRLVGLTGSEEQVKAASQAYRTYYKKNAPQDGDPDYYLVDHSTFSYLVFPGEGFVDFFRRDIGPEAMADRIGCFLDAAS